MAFQVAVRRLEAAGWQAEWLSPRHIQPSGELRDPVCLYLTCDPDLPQTPGRADAHLLWSGLWVGCERTTHLGTIASAAVAAYAAALDGALQAVGRTLFNSAHADVGRRRFSAPWAVAAVASVVEHVSPRGSVFLDRHVWGSQPRLRMSPGPSDSSNPATLF